MFNTGQKKAERNLYDETNVYAPQVYLNKGNLVMNALYFDNEITLRVQSIPRQRVLLFQRTIDEG